MPLFPRAANPASEFQAVLDLARASATRHAVADIEDGNYAAALAKLDALAAGSFHWRGAVSNGYQQGFFLCALRGYCLETLGEVVKAYRSYQNSRACFDDDAVAMQCPEPRLEVFLGLGRTCNVAGRYTDAFTWLDLVRLEAADLPHLAVAADRGLIRRAIEIGDYHDAITNFWDLQCLLRECGSDLRVANAALDEESGRGSPSHTNRNQCAENDHFARPERNLSREEHKDLAQLYFWTHQDRPGFKTLLDGITLLGIDNDLSVRDPMVDAYLNNIMRADDAEIQYFYHLIGYAVTQARVLKGDEEYLAFLCNVRTLLCRIYEHLSPHDDLGEVGKRIEEVKLRCDAAVLENRLERHQKSIKPTVSQEWSQLHSATDTTSSEMGWLCEELLMQADCARFRNDYTTSQRYYLKAYALATNTTCATGLYDGTTLLNAAVVGIGMSCWLSQQEYTSCYPCPAIDGSFRAREFLLARCREVTLGRMGLKKCGTSTDTVPAVLEKVRDIDISSDTYPNDVDTEHTFGMNIAEFNLLPPTSPAILAAFHAMFKKAVMMSKKRLALDISGWYLLRHPGLPMDMSRTRLALLLEKGDVRQMVAATLHDLRYCTAHWQRIDLVFLLRDIAAWASQSELRDASYCIKGAPIANYLSGRAMFNLRECMEVTLSWPQKEYPLHLACQELLGRREYDKVLDVTKVVGRNSAPYYLSRYKAEALLGIGRTNDACRVLKKAYGERQMICSRMTREKTASIHCVGLELAMLEDLTASIADAQLAAQYSNWFNTIKR